MGNPHFMWFGVEFVRQVRRITPGMDRDGVDVHRYPEILQVASGDMGLVIEDEQGRQVVIEGSPEAVQRLTKHLHNLALRGAAPSPEPAWEPEPYDG